MIMILIHGIDTDIQDMGVLTTYKYKVQIIFNSLWLDLSKHATYFCITNKTT